MFPTLGSQHWAVRGMFSRKKDNNSVQAQPRCCLHADELLAAIRTSELATLALSKRIEALEQAMRGLDAVRQMLEAKTLMAYQRRLAGRVKAGCARAASAQRDAHGRYLPT
jgi:hypothetical protein